MIFFKKLLFIGLSTSLLLAAPSSKKDAQLKSIIKMGERGSSLLIKTLSSKMKKSMQKGGVSNAFEFCSNQAYALTQKVNTKLPIGVSVKRISQRYRSPANAPQKNELHILQMLQIMKELNIILPKYLIEQVDTYKYKYYKPIIIDKKVCLKCHGNIINTDIKQAIAKRYPLDNAIKYKMRDIRGAIVVTIDKSVK